MLKKKILAIHLNEFNLEFLRKGANKYNCQNIKKILNYKIIKTYSQDKIQEKNLDPWVQSVSINTGIKSKIHKIYNLGEKIPNKLNQIWDILSKRNIKCAVWGAMNASYKKNDNLKIFFPDPWNNLVSPRPVDLKYVFQFPKAYAQNYTDFKIINNLYSLLLFFLSCLKFGILTYFAKKIIFYLKIFLTSGLSNYFLFFLFDIISINLFKNYTKNKELDFSLIFLNSLAHFQHNNWDEKKNYHKYFLLTEEICKIINQISLKYDDIIIYNGFTQKRIKTEFIIRPKNPNKFLKKIGINFKKLNTNMTNGGILSFNNKKQKEISIKKLKNFNIFGYKLFKITNIVSNNIFFKIQIKSHSSFDNLSINPNKEKIIKEIFYDNKKLTFKTINLNYSFDNFKNDMVFIKTTGKHHYEGHLLMKNQLTKKNKIENKDIFLLLKNYFK